MDINANKKGDYFIFIYVEKYLQALDDCGPCSASTCLQTQSLIPPSNFSVSGGWRGLHTTKSHGIFIFVLILPYEPEPPFQWYIYRTVNYLTYSFKIGNYHHKKLPLSKMVLFITNRLRDFLIIFLFCTGYKIIYGSQGPRS